MKSHAIICLIFIGACASSPHPSSLKKLEQRADASWENHDFRGCEQAYFQLAHRTDDRSAKANAYYYSACCSALAKRTDVTFATLKLAAENGYNNYVRIVNDPALDKMRIDARWATTIAAVETNLTKTLKAPSLRKELLAHTEADQEVRTRWLQNQSDTILAQEVVAVDARNLSWFKQIVTTRGWPGKSLVGGDGANAAWLLAQHADQDLEFQKLCLTLIEPLVAIGEVEAQDVAYLYDRIAVASNRPQRYGTQFKNSTEPFPIEDPVNVDARRATVGLDSLADYKKVLATRHQAPQPAGTP